MVSGVNVIGPVFGELGIGEDVRTLVQALILEEIPVSVFSYPTKLATREANKTFEKYVSADLVYDCNIFCMPAIESLRFVLEFGCQSLSNRYNIGYWPWELENWPKELTFVERFMDEIWASSMFILDCYQRAFRQPVFHIPLILDEHLNPNAVDIQFPFQDENLFKFLFIFDANSTIERKNPKGLIHAFKCAFGNRKDVHLILKTMNYRHTDSDFDGLLETSENIFLINESYNKSQILALYEATDSYVSLHRSEGFGRTLAEAMLSKRPVIASRYSGNLDFCDEDTAFLVEGNLVSVKPYSYPLWRNARWFDPVHQSAVDALRLCVERPDIRSRKVEAAYSSISNKFSLATVAKKIKERILNI